MPGKVKVKVIAGRNLPIMDRSSETTDAYVEIKLGQTTFKTDVCRKSLHPQWNSEWYKFELDDAELQDEPLQMRLMDHDTYSANDAIGKVYLDLNPLLLLPGGPSLICGRHNETNTHENATNSVMSGWVPVFDTMHGIRGEVNIIVKVELFSDSNRYRQSSCGVQFFCSSAIPNGYHAETIHGFVEELIVSDDPEYQWIDKIRTPRASNEARQTLFFKLSGELQRKIGVKTLEMGANAVLGFKQHFDLEGDSGGIVARGIGTAVTLLKVDVDVNTDTMADDKRIQSYMKFLGSSTKFCLNSEAAKSSTSSVLKEFFNNKTINQSDNKTQSNLNLMELALCRKDSMAQKKLNNFFKYRNKNYFQNIFAKKRNSTYGKSFDCRLKKSASSTSLMAELLARSVLNAPKSLVSALETHSEESETLDKHTEIDSNNSNSSGKKSNLSDSIGQKSSESLSSDDDSKNTDFNNWDDDIAFETVSNIVKDVGLNLLNIGIKRHSLPTLPVSNWSDSVEGCSLLFSTKSTDLFEEPKKDMSGQLYVKEGSLKKSLSYESLNENLKSYNSLTILPEQISLPPIHVDNMENKSLVKTAIQTILLEKVNIVGTCTPPISPTYRNAPSLNFQDNLTNLDKEHKSLIAPENTVHISVSSLPHSDCSCQDHKEKETILSIPFQSISANSLNKSRNEFLSFSDFELDQPAIVLEDILKSKQKQLQAKRKFSIKKFLTADFLPSRRGTITDSHKFSEHRRLSFFPKKAPFLSELKKEKSISMNDNEIRKKNFRFFPLFKDFNKQNSAKTSQNLYISSPSSKVSLDFSKDMLEKNDLILTNSELTSNDLTDLNVSDPSSVSNNMLASLTLSARCNNSLSMDQKDQNIDAKTSPAKIGNKSSLESDCKGTSYTVTETSYSKRQIMLRSKIHPDNFDLIEYPFLTMSKYPKHLILHLGGAVSARSVKLLDRISNVEEPETRDSWWCELRLEIRSHARSLNCNAILGYSETASICGDICVLSASGTAAIIGESPIDIGESNNLTRTKDIMTTSQEKCELEKEKNSLETNLKICSSSPGNEKNFKTKFSCTICHMPLNGNAVKSPMLKCGMCGMASVPDILISTVEVPDDTPVMGRGCLLQTSVCRPLRDLHGESHAKEISDGLPFLEYELHRLLINKLKVKGMNAIFGLKIKITIGERMLIGIATGTAVYLLPLPRPVIPKLISDRTIDEKRLIELQKLLNVTVKKNREIYQLKGYEDIYAKPIYDDDSENDSLDFIKETKDCCVLELDDPNDIEIMNLIKEGCPPEGFHVVNTEYVPGLEELEIIKNLQMFKQIHRSKIHPPFNLDHHFQKLLHCVYFKLRRMIPCAICDLQFRVDLPEPDEIQLTVLGMALGLGDPPKMEKIGSNNIYPKSDELIFNFEEETNGEISSTLTTSINKNKLKSKQKSPVKQHIKLTNQRHTPHRGRPGVDITPLSYIPGGKIDKYLGNLNFFLIRESTSIREEGGLSGFLHSFITEVLAIVRAHVTALGGNAMVGYFLTECVLNYNLHKNQGQCLINVGGDVVNVSYYNEEK